MDHYTTDKLTVSNELLATALWSLFYTLLAALYDAASLLISGSVTTQINAIQHKSNLSDAPLYIIQHLDQQLIDEIHLAPRLYWHSDRKKNQNKEINKW